MKNKPYRAIFLKCEDKKRKYPNAFEAQWK